jgi:serine protease Do
MPEMSSGFIHTSCAMEVGDSGGPLFDIKGHVIGLNSRCDVSEEWNYQVPVDLYRKYWSSLSLMENYTSFPYRSDSIGRPAVADTAQSPFIVPAQAAIPYKGASCQVVSNQEDGKQQSTGATVLAAGMYLKDKNASGTYLISKSSCIGDKPMVQLPSGKKTGADIIARSIQQDLVLLYVKEKIPGGVSLDTSYGTSPNTGAFLYSLLPDGQQKRGIAGSQPFYLPAKFSGGYFGANATFKGGAVTLTSIQPNSPVIPAGLQLEDKILSINHVSLNKPEDYGSELMKHFPHEKITLEVKRQDSLFEKEVTLGTRTERKSAHLAEQFEGGKSSRRDGFANVFLYDGRIKADECGAPVFDAQGRCRGMAIARFSRTATLVMPVADIVKWLHQLNS